MAEETNISWADRTFSPWTGCTKISPACQGCYAAFLMDTRMHRAEWGEPGSGEGTRDLMSSSYWKKPLAWNRQSAKDGSRPTIFPSLCDPFDKAVDKEWRVRFFNLMWETPNLTWLLMTKRIGNVMKMTDPRRGERTLPPNVAIGSTFANQEEWDRDSGKLEEVASTLKPLFTFGSYEPLLSGIRFGNGFMPDWVITGGETDQGAHRARPSNPQWFRDIRDQCADRGVPFHFKQWGNWASVSEIEGSKDIPSEHFTFPDGATVRRIPKNSPPTLDGKYHKEFPRG